MSKPKLPTPNTIDQTAHDEAADVAKIVKKSGKGPRDGGAGTWGASGTIEHRPEHNIMGKK